MLNQLLDRILPVLGGIANIFLLGTDDLRKSLMQGEDDLRRVIRRQRGLGHIGKEPRVFDLEPRDVFHEFHKVHAADTVRAPLLAQGSFDLLVSGLADQNALSSLILVAVDLHMHLGHQGAGRIAAL